MIDSKDLIVLNSGERLKIGSLTFKMISPVNVTVSGYSTYRFSENLTRGTTIKELNDIKCEYHELLKNDNLLQNFIAYKLVQFNLFFKYETGQALVAFESDGNVHWMMDLK